MWSEAAKLVQDAKLTRADLNTLFAPTLDDIFDAKGKPKPGKDALGTASRDELLSRIEGVVGNLDKYAAELKTSVERNREVYQHPFRHFTEHFALKRNIALEREGQFVIDHIRDPANNHTRAGKLASVKQGLLAQVDLAKYPGAQLGMPGAEKK